MPVKSAKQFGLFEAIAHGDKKLKGVGGPSKTVANEFLSATPRLKKSNFAKALFGEQKKKKVTPDYRKLVFWLLTFVSVVMTSIGASAASHLVAQMDSLSIRISSLEAQNSILGENKVETERRLIRIEDKLDSIRDKQDER